MSDPTATNPVDPSFRDASLPIGERVENLLAQMTLEEKAGLFFHTMITIGEDGELAEANPVFGIPSTAELVDGSGMTHFNVLGAAARADPDGALAQQAAGAGRLLPASASR